MESHHNWETAPVIDGIELAAFEKMCGELFAKKVELDDVREIEKELSAKVEAMKRKVLEYMERFGKEKYPVSEWGTLSVSTRFTAKMPQDSDDRSKFFDYLREKGCFETLITVHANTLNSFVQKEIEAAANPDFTLPGIKDFGHYKTLSMRRK